MGFKQTVALYFVFSLLATVVLYRIFQVAIAFFASEGLTSFEQIITALFTDSSYINRILQRSLQPPWFVYNRSALFATGLVGLFIFAILVQFALFSNRHPYKGVEQGSARFGTAQDIANYIAKPPPGKPYFYNRKNVILTKTEGLSIDRKEVAKPEYYRTANILVIGGTGSGKTRYFVTPMLCRCTVATS